MLSQKRVLTVGRLIIEGKGPGQIFFVVQFEVPEYEEGEKPEPTADVEEGRQQTEDKKLSEDID